MYKIKAILKVMCMILVPMLITNIFYYIVGVFVAWDFNPAHWAVFTNTWGRIVLVVLELATLSSAQDFWNGLNE